jgi:BlaI family transcriptional regulator, penicillinase repressor
MAGKQEARTPTPAELAILSEIWERGAVTVREVHDAIGKKQGVGLTTVLKLMQIMTEKGLLHCDGSVRPQVFRAAGPRQQTQRRMLRDLLERAFGGSPGNLVLQALSMKKPSEEELRQIRKLLDSQKGGGG